MLLWHQLFPQHPQGQVEQPCSSFERTVWVFDAVTHTLTFSFCRSTEDAGLSLTSADNKSLISPRKLPQCYWWNHSDSTLVVIALLLAPSRAALAKCHSVPLVLIMAAVSSEESHRLSCSYWGLPALESSCLVWLWPAGPASPRWHDQAWPAFVSLFHFRS